MMINTDFLLAKCRETPPSPHKVKPYMSVDDI